MGAAAVTGLRELVRAFGPRHIRVPVIPVAAGGAAIWVCEYWWNDRAVLAALALTVVAVFAWRLPGGPDGYLRDVMAGLFALGYVPFLAVFIVALLAPADGARRVLIFIVLNVCVDVGGYFAGSLLGRHICMAPVISPSKTWEGLAGSMLICLAGGAVLIPWLLHGHIWQGIVTGVAAAAAAVVGDLAESAIKRDLQIKDMGTLLPGHGGVLDRIDSHLMAAPVTWLLLAVFVTAHTAEPRSALLSRGSPARQWPPGSAGHPAPALCGERGDQARRSLLLGDQPFVLRDRHHPQPAHRDPRRRRSRTGPAPVRPRSGWGLGWPGRARDWRPRSPPRSTFRRAGRRRSSPCRTRP